MTGKIVHHDDVARPQDGNQKVLYETNEHGSVDGAFDDHRRGNFAGADGGQHGRSTPMPARDRIHETSRFGRPTRESFHARVGTAFVETNEPCWIHLPHLASPLCPLALHVGALLLAGTQ